MESQDINDIIIVGSGPAGLTSALYAARANLRPLVLAGEIWGGQLMNTTVVENFPGFPEGIEGPQLMQNMMDQAKKFGAEIKFENVNFVDLKKDIKTIKTSKGEYKAKAVILATGSAPRKLNIPGEDKFYGRGVSTCATCDGAFYKDKIVAVVGGGDSAMEEANFLTRFAKKVYIIHRRDTFKASKIMVDRVLKNEKIEIIYNTVVTEIIGENNVEAIMVGAADLLHPQNNHTLLVDGLFLAIGHIPVTEYLKDIIPLDEQGYAIVNVPGKTSTNIEGVFLAGEIQDHYYKQAITTAAEGCKAALEAQRWLEEKGI